MFRQLAFFVRLCTAAPQVRKPDMVVAAPRSLTLACMIFVLDMLELLTIRVLYTLKLGSLE